MANPPARWRLILNGKSAGNEDVRAAVEAARERGIRLSVRVTWEGGDAERYVAEAIADGVDTIVACGGDGTLSEVASTLAQRDAHADALPSLGLVPLGTANDFAMAAGIPEAPDAAFALIESQPARAIDLLDLIADGTPHWAANLASGGFGTAVTVETHEGLKSLLGGLAYAITGLAKLGSIEPIAARIHGPGFRWEGRFIALAVGNGRQAGGGHVLCPDAVIDDGLLDLTIVPELDDALGATLGALVTQGRDAALERVAVRAQLSWVEIDGDSALTLNLDGEPIESGHFRIECAAGRLRMHLPAVCPLLLAPAKPIVPGPSCNPALTAIPA